MVGEMFESFFDLLDQGMDNGSEQESSNENHPSRECHMVQITPVVVRDGAALEVPPAGAVPNNEAEQASHAPPPDPTQLHQLQERRRELDDVRRQLALEQEAVDCELEQQMGGRHARARACDINDQIVNAKPDENLVARAGQNIVAAAALLETLPEQVTPEAQRVQRRMADLLARATQQQESDSQRCVAQLSRRTASTRNNGAGNDAGRRDATVQQNPRPQGEQGPLSVHSHIGTERDARRTIKALRRVEAEHGRDHVRHPHQGGQHDEAENRSRSPGPLGSRAFSSDIRVAVFPQRYPPPPPTTVD